MKLSTYLTITGVLGMLFGVCFLLVPQITLPLYGMPADPHTLMLNRYFGATLGWLGLMVWLARHVRDGAAIRAILQGSAIGNVVGALLSVWAALSGLQNAMAWTSVAIYTLLLLGALYFLASPERSGSAARAA